MAETRKLKYDEAALRTLTREDLDALEIGAGILGTGGGGTDLVRAVTQADKDALLAPDILPSFTVDSFISKGAILRGAALQHTGPLALIELQNGSAEPSYVAGTENFYVITRYNWSSYYAMAVIELGLEVKQAL